jgi:DNA-directed RNA polymerase specialized sigma24 family protein
MDEMEERLRQLVTEACKHLPGSRERQKNLTKIICLTSNKLWKENTPYFEDALQQTWMYCCRNICERNTGERYDPTRGSVTTWLNTYLKRRLQDFYIDGQKQQARTVPGEVWVSRSGESYGTIDRVENLEANPDVPPLIEEVSRWVQTDRELRHTHIEGRPDVTCQVLLLRRLPPETSWKTLAMEFGLSVSTLSCFYQRQCLPRLRQFGESQGYL